MECHLAGVDTIHISRFVFVILAATKSLSLWNGRILFLSTQACLPGVLAEEKTTLAQITHLALNLHVLFLTVTHVFYDANKIGPDWTSYSCYSIISITPTVQFKKKKK